MFRFVNGITLRFGVRPTSSPSRSLISHSAPHLIHTTPGYLTGALKTRENMAKVVPQTRPLPEVDPSQILTSAEKKQRLEVEVGPSEEQAVASTSARPATTKQKQANGETRSKKKASKKKKHKHLPPEPYSHDDVLWRDVRDLLGADVAGRIIKEGNEWESPFQSGEEIQVEVSVISSTGTPVHHRFSCGFRLKPVVVI